jgi:hypothetical protein
MTVSRGWEDVAIVVPDTAGYTELSQRPFATVGAEGGALASGRL